MNKNTSSRLFYYQREEKTENQKGQSNENLNEQKRT